MDRSSEKALREEILSKVATYYELKHKKKEFIPGVTRILYAGRVFDERDMVNLVDASLDFWLTMGRYAQEFESRFAEYIGVKHAVSVTSCTTGLHVATQPLRLGKEDEVIDGAIAVIERRINILGVTEPVIQKQGADRILVELPGIGEAEKAKRLIGQTALLEFRELVTNADGEAEWVPTTAIVNG